MSALREAMDFGRVALVVGGDSPERDVSLAGGVAVGAALERLGIDYQLIDGARELFAAIEAGRVDRVFNLMHGTGGEDGSLSGALRLYGIPVTGSGVLGSALSMDKVRSKQLWRSRGIPTTDFMLTSVDAGNHAEILRRFGLPLFVKPVDQGSSLGISKVTHADRLAAAIEVAAEYGRQVMVEPAIEGREYFAGLLQDIELPLIAVEPAGEFYDYQAKYESDETRYFCPCGLGREQERALQQASRRAFEVLGASGWGRVDFILDQTGQPWFLEINTIPGMTGHSLIPQAAAEMGIGFDELVRRILETSFQETAV